MKKGMQLLFRSNWGIPLVLVLFLLIAWISAQWHFRLDLTNEKRYTLSKGTKQLLGKLDSNINIDICLGGDYPGGFRNLGSQTMEMLDEFKEYAGNKISYQLVSLDDAYQQTASTYADTLRAMGVKPITDEQKGKSNQKKQLIYPVALLRGKDTTIVVELFSGSKPFINSRDLSLELGKELNQAEALLEYKLAEGIDKIIKHGMPKPLIGYAVGHGEPLDDHAASLALEVIRPNYEMTAVDLEHDSIISPDIRALIMLKPTKPFTEIENLKIDQYIMNGGKVLFFAEPLQAEMDTFRIKHRIIPFNQQLNVTDLIYHYGARINPKILLDVQCDQYPLMPAEDGRTFNLIPWNCCPKLSGNSKHPITENVDLVNAKFANTIDLIQTKDVKATVLLQGSAHSRTLSQGDIILGNENVSDAGDPRFHQANLPVAVLLEGNFTSYFANSITSAQKNYLNQYGNGFVPSVKAPGKLLVVADGDIVMNDFDAYEQPLSMGINKYTQGTDQEFVFANKKFILNALEYFTNDNKNGLIESRNKSFILRLLDPQKVDAEKTKWQLINILLPVSLILIFALFFTQLRKRKYTHQ